MKRKNYNSLFPAILTSMVLTTTANAAATQNGACEISGHNLMMAYQRAINNGNRFLCMKKRATFKSNNSEDSPSWHHSDHYVYIPTPSGLLCQYTPLNDPTKPLLNRNINNGTYTFSLSLFRNGLRNGWKIADYTAHGGGTKINTSGRRVLFQKKRDGTQRFALTLKKMWIKKNGFSCNNMNAVLDSAFGR